jgi:glc operon protein GlcG
MKPKAVASGPAKSSAAGPGARGLIVKRTVSLALARELVAAAEVEAAKNNWTMVVSVVDDGANLICLERMDGTQLASIDISQAKARTALRLKRPTKAVQDLINQGNPALATLPDITAVQGGLPIVVDRTLVGAIGVSGGTSAQDEQCAQAALDTALAQ